MATISEKLNKIKNAKEDIKNSIANKGVTVGDNIETYASKIDEMQVADFEINDCYYLFAYNTRMNIHDKLLPLCKNVTRTTNMYVSNTQVTNLDFSNFDNSKNTNMMSMCSGCSNLKELIFGDNFDTSQVTTVSNMISGCKLLERVDLSSFDTSKVVNTTSMSSNCSKLATIIINNPKVFKMTHTNTLNGTPIANGTGYVYVPDNMVETYKSATNWSTYADQIKGISELPTKEA